jgi:hypothetical protein
MTNHPSNRVIHLQIASPGPPLRGAASKRSLYRLTKKSEEAL